ncbi:MAG: hypothetical protein D8M58_21320 [Calditrichaeota bacterium]|nr:MAG: hypothetical protein DWQ03_00045 [Calditrichota bacterium]MBL1207954.1 hypothetical protein [Calditrichota bacterium]NOG47791.1 hypothetical protein [Calditrichota bacterium]
MDLSDLAVMLDLLIERVDLSQDGQTEKFRSEIKKLKNDKFKLDFKTDDLMNDSFPNVYLGHLIKLNQLESFSENRFIHYLGFKSLFPEKEYIYSGFIGSDDRFLIREKIKRLNENRIYNDTLEIVKSSLSGNKPIEVDYFLDQINKVKNDGHRSLKDSITNLETKSGMKLLEGIFQYYSHNFAPDSFKELFIELYSKVLSFYEKGQIGNIQKDKRWNNFKKRYLGIADYFRKTKWHFKRDFIVLDLMYYILTEYRRAVRKDQISKIMLNEKEKRVKKIELLKKYIENNKSTVLNISTFDQINYIQNLLKEIKNIQNQVDYIDLIYFNHPKSTLKHGRPKLTYEYSFILQCYDFALKIDSIKNAKEWTSTFLNLIIRINNEVNTAVNIDEMYYSRTPENIKDVVKEARKIKEDVDIHPIFN